MNRNPLKHVRLDQLRTNKCGISGKHFGAMNGFIVPNIASPNRLRRYVLHLQILYSWIAGSVEAEDEPLKLNLHTHDFYRHILWLYSNHKYDLPTSS